MSHKPACNIIMYFTLAGADKVWSSHTSCVDSANNWDVTADKNSAFAMNCEEKRA